MDNINIKYFTNRKLLGNYKTCPEVYLQKLEIKRYAMNTAKSYIFHFEKFINFYPKSDLIELDENDVRKYLSYLVQQGKSNSFLNQAVNSIKFYYEVVLEMPNRFMLLNAQEESKFYPKSLARRKC